MTKKSNAETLTKTISEGSQRLISHKYDAPLTLRPPYRTSEMLRGGRDTLIIETKPPLSRSAQGAYVNYKGRVLLALMSYSIFYGVFIINLIDLELPVKGWYHIFLIIMYFCPSILLLALFGLRNWDLALAVGLLISLMNDLFYGPLGNILSVTNYNLLWWYSWQLGLYGMDQRWIFQGGPLNFRVTSFIMGLSIYVRLIAVCILLLEWWRKK
ncbi:MAG: hypothetical protein QXE73_00040 [Candidatus Bathyarchaeia archaeon]|nr:hypothetical protein [Candidatus Bathyarchaeota archaeon]